jgi:hypothetical protein
VVLFALVIPLILNLDLLLFRSESQSTHGTLKLKPFLSVEPRLVGLRLELSSVLTTRF